MAFQWTDGFELGHRRIDAEHRIFMRLLEEFEERVERSAPLTDLRRTLREIQKYAEFHFVSEENIMEELGYPGTQAHRRIHEELLALLDRRIKALGDGSLAARELLHMLADWFSVHTAEEDAKLVEHINGIGWSQINVTNPFF
jgi:hemerythrin